MIIKCSVKGEVDSHTCYQCHEKNKYYSSRIACKEAHKIVEEVTKQNLN